MATVDTTYPTQRWTQPGGWWRDKQYESFDYDSVSRVGVGIFVSGAVKMLPAGIDAVVNIQNEPDPYPTWQYRSIKASLHLPKDDSPDEAPDMDWLDFVTNAIEGMRANDWNVLIHCGMGISRSGMVAVAYVMRHDYLTLAEALRKVQAGRRVVSPNSGFMRSLKQWEEALAPERKAHKAAERERQELDDAKRKAALPFGVNPLAVVESSDASEDSEPGCAECGALNGHDPSCSLFGADFDQLPGFGEIPDGAGAGVTQKSGRPVCSNCECPDDAGLHYWESALWCADCKTDEIAHRERVSKPIPVGVLGGDEYD
jgi:hypothetical protein